MRYSRRQQKKNRCLSAFSAESLRKGIHYLQYSIIQKYINTAMCLDELMNVWWYSRYSSYLVGEVDISHNPVYLYLWSTFYSGYHHSCSTDSTSCRAGHPQCNGPDRTLHIDTQTKMASILRWNHNMHGYDILSHWKIQHLYWTVGIPN